MNRSATDCQPCDRFVAVAASAVTCTECDVPGSVLMCATCKQDHHVGGWQTCARRMALRCSHAACVARLAALEPARGAA